MVHQAVARHHDAEPIVVRVTREHDIPRPRQAARSLAEAVGLGRVAVHEVATSASELAANLVFHATRGGTITLSPLLRDGEVGLEIIAEDDGPGIPDVGLAMQDGFTTNRGIGSGLPAVRRLMDEFEVTSSVGVGTRIVARRWQRCR